MMPRTWGVGWIVVSIKFSPLRSAILTANIEGMYNKQQAVQHSAMGIATGGSPPERLIHHTSMGFDPP